MLLLWGHAGDATLQAVHRALSRYDVPVAFYDQRRVIDTDLELLVHDSLSGTLRVEDDEIALADVVAAYIRPYDSRWLPAVSEAGPRSQEWQYAASVEDALLSWCDISPALVINRPSAMASNGSKPFQADLIRHYGFRVPETLVSTDPDAVRAFWEDHGTVIYKSVSASRSMVSVLTSGDAERLDRVRWCPTQFQQHIPGIDYRVHVVGDRVFTCEICSPAADYRFALARHEPVEQRAAELPDAVAARCVTLTRGLGLVVSGIDLRRTPDDEWYCFEANAVPAFTYYQVPTGHAIDAAVAGLLVEASRGAASHVAPTPAAASSL